MTSIKVQLKDRDMSTFGMVKEYANGQLVFGGKKAKVMMEKQQCCLLKSKGKNSHQLGFVSIEDNQSVSLLHNFSLAVKAHRHKYTVSQS